MENTGSNYLAMDLGSSQPTSVPMETIEVEVSASSLLSELSRRFVREAARKNVLKVEQIGLTEEEVVEYSKFLLSKRLEVINNTCKDFQATKVMYMPGFIQHVLSMIGIVVDREYGLKLVPVMKTEEKVTLDVKAALAISEKIGSLVGTVSVVENAMPRDIYGNKDVMSTALIAGYVRARHKVEHIAATYVTALLEMRLKKEAAFAALYRVTYDDLDFITSVLPTFKGWFE